MQILSYESGLYFEPGYLWSAALVHQLNLATAIALEQQYYSCKTGHSAVVSGKILTGNRIIKSKVVLYGYYIFNYKSESNSDIRKEHQKSCIKCQ